MSRIPPFLFLAPVLALATAAPLSAQSEPQSEPAAPHERVRIVPAPSEVDQLPPGKVKTVPGPTLVPPKSPFALDDRQKSSGSSIRILSEAEMSATDRD